MAMSKAIKKEFDAKLLFTDILYDIAGCGLLAIGITCFSAPNNIAPGGVTGLSIMGNYLFGIPISVLTFSMNIPLLILAWFFLGRTFAIKTMKSVAILTLMLQLVSLLLPVYRGNVLLAALYGGVIDGAGIALVFMRSSTTGGSDIGSRLIQLKLPTVSVGRLMLCIDFFVLLTAALVYRNIENALYGLIAIFATTSVLDNLLYGLDTGKLMMIMTKNPVELTDAISKRIGRSCTILDGTGSFTKRSQPVVLCVMRKAQYFDLKRVVHEVDPAAFMFALDASEVIGEGFKDIKESTKVQ